MKISPMRTIAISAYLSAMLASSVPSIRSGVTLAAPLDPEIVKMMVDMNGGRPVETPHIPAPTSKAVHVSAEAKVGAFGRLRAFTLNHQNSTRLGAGAAYFLGLPKNDISTKQTSSTIPDGKCYFSVNLANHDDIFMIVKREGMPLTLYLTNSKLEWRGAAINGPGKPRSMTQEESAAGFEALLEFWIENSKTLPSNTLVNNS